MVEFTLVYVSHTAPKRILSHIMDKNETELVKQRIHELRIEHRDLDDVIARLSSDIHVDQLQLRRLKKRKLYLRDSIERLESKLIPDLDA